MMIQFNTATEPKAEYVKIETWKVTDALDGIGEIVLNVKAFNYGTGNVAWFMTREQAQQIINLLQEEIK